MSPPPEGDRVASLVEALEDLLDVHQAAVRYLFGRLDDVRVGQINAKARRSRRRLPAGGKVLDGGAQAQAIRHRPPVGSQP